MVRKDSAPDGGKASKTLHQYYEASVNSAELALLVTYPVTRLCFTTSGGNLR
jgi:hypothetical protein